MTDDTISIPKRALFKAAEVCEIAHVQPYVLRTWETEFPDIGATRTGGGSRYYRRSDVQRVLRIKQLLFDEGLTLAGVRRRLNEEQRPEEEAPPTLDELLGRDARERLARVKEALNSIQSLLSGDDKLESVGVSASKRPTVARSKRAGRRSSRALASRPKKSQSKRKRART